MQIVPGIWQIIALSLLKLCVSECHWQQSICNNYMPVVEKIWFESSQELIGI